jgi:hypothetical protein
MIVDALRQVADWLADATHGVNAILGAVPQDSGAEVIPAVTIRDETRTAWVARAIVPREKVAGGPLLLVRMGVEGTEIPLNTQAGFPRTTIPVDVWYVTALADTDLVVTYAVQTLRAAGRVLAARYTGTMGALTRNGTDLEAPQQGRIELVMEPLAGDDLVVARLTFAIPAVDPWGLAAIPLPPSGD